MTDTKGGHTPRQMTRAEFALRTSTVARIAAQWTNELVFGMLDPRLYSAPAGSAERFVEEIEYHLEVIRAAIAKATPQRESKG